MKIIKYLIELIVIFNLTNNFKYKYHNKLRLKHKFKKNKHQQSHKQSKKHSSPKYEKYWEIQIPSHELAQQKENNRKAQQIFEESPQGRDESDNDEEGELYIRSAQQAVFKLVKAYINKHSIYYGCIKDGYRGIEEALELQDLQQDQIGVISQERIKVEGESIQGECFRIDSEQEWVVCSSMMEMSVKWRHLILMHLIKNMAMNDHTGRMLHQIKPDCSSSFIPFDYHSQYLWGCSCQGHYQSPINIDTSSMLNSPLPIQFHYQSSQSPTLHSTHVQQTLLLPFGHLLYKQQKYNSHSIRVKFPSEHSIDGHHHAAELQLLHDNPMGDTLILSVLLSTSQGQDGDAFINQLQFDRWPSLSLENKDTCLERVEIDLHSLMAVTGGSYYGYKGSDSQPPCQEGVQWLIMKQPLKVHHLVLAALQAKVIGAQSTNSRSIQHNPMQPQILSHDQKNCTPIQIEPLQNMQYVSVQSTQHVYGIVHPDTPLAIPTQGKTVLRNGQQALSMEVLSSQQMAKENSNIMTSLMHSMGKHQQKQHYK